MIVAFSRQTWATIILYGYGLFLSPYHDIIITKFFTIVKIFFAFFKYFFTIVKTILYAYNRKENIYIMIYNNNDDIIAMIDYYLNTHSIKKSLLAEKLGMSRQAFNYFIRKRNFRLEDIKKIADVLGLDVEINLVERDKKEKRILKQKENDFEVLEQQQRQMMNNFNILGLAQYRTMENVEKLTTQLEEIYKTIETLNKRTEKIEEENETADAPAPEGAKQSEEESKRRDGTDGTD